MATWWIIGKLILKPPYSSGACFWPGYKPSTPNLCREHRVALPWLPCLRTSGIYICMLHQLQPPMVPWAPQCTETRNVDRKIRSDLRLGVAISSGESDIPSASVNVWERNSSGPSSVTLSTKVSFMSQTPGLDFSKWGPMPKGMLSLIGSTCVLYLWANVHSYDTEQDQAEAKIPDLTTIHLSLPMGVKPFFWRILWGILHTLYEVLYIRTATLQTWCHESGNELWGGYTGEFYRSL